MASPQHPHSASPPRQHPAAFDISPTIAQPYSPDALYKRASRRGAARRFPCEHDGCDKIYTRAEHLQRHQLNHNPRQIFQCDVSGCDQKFVRLDLLTRHKKRHCPNYTPRNRVPSFNTSREQTESYNEPAMSPSHTSHLSHPEYSAHLAPSQPQPPPPTGPVDAPQQQPPPLLPHPAHQAAVAANSSGPHDAAILLTPESNTDPPPMNLPHALPRDTSAVPPLGTSWGACPHADAEKVMPSLLRTKSSFFAPEPATAIVEQTHLDAFSHLQYSTEEELSQANFAAWLFDPQSNYRDLNFSSLPFLETGLESTFNSNIHYDYESLASRSQVDQTPPRHVDPEDWISESRRLELIRWFQVFRQKQPKYDPFMRTFCQESTNGDLPGLSVDMMRECLKEYWDIVSPRLAIVHQHTFSPNRCPVSLLFVMLALGAGSLKNRDLSGRMAEYGPFGDVIIASVRWEILTSDDAAPPASLWVAQALLLVEFYEKFYSTRRFHERAHIYHSAFLTLLRRGSPLIGRAGSESPPVEMENSNNSSSSTSTSGIRMATNGARCGPTSTPAPAPTTPGMAGLDSRSWWIRWADTESMHRVVFAAFILDIVHAAMFGHAADMAAHEIRLPLPCDDNLWTASSPDVVRQLDANFRMYGVKQVSFLDGLKAALHGKEVKTHAFGRMIIMSGLLSVGWHLSHKEKHLKWADLRTPVSETQDSWRVMLLKAFDNWKVTFDLAISVPMPSNGGNLGVCGSIGPVSSASVLYHLAHLSLHSDIVDCQLYAGAKRLLGRRISHRDYANAVKRMTSWAKLASTRHAVLHGFKLLYQLLVVPQSARRHPYTEENNATNNNTNNDHNPSPHPMPSSAPYGILDPLTIFYSIRSDPDPHRPWIMYYCILTIWAFVQALGPPPRPSLPPVHVGHDTCVNAAHFLANVASLRELTEHQAATLYEGMPGLLEIIWKGILAEADTDLLLEARERLRICEEMLLAPPR